jgi:hypothetical protein
MKTQEQSDKGVPLRYRQGIQRRNVAMPRRTPLVCQHLENVSRDVLEEYQDIVRQYVRHQQGVYALFRRGKIYYVGLASNLRTRLGHHLKDRHHDSWDRFSVYITIGDSHMRELESPHFRKSVFFCFRLRTETPGMPFIARLNRRRFSSPCSPSRRTIRKLDFMRFWRKLRNKPNTYE